MKVILYIWAGLIVICLGLTANHVIAQDTTINYKGQPVPTAMAPSMSAFSQDVCGIPLSAAVSTIALGVSGGTVYTDANCERIKLAKTLSDMQLKVAAVGVLCADDRVWEAMMMSGTPCPIDGLVGDAARDAWIKQHPLKFVKLYGKVPPLSTANLDKPKEQ
jgi:hypothetical protein